MSSLYVNMSEHDKSCYLDGIRDSIDLLNNMILSIQNKKSRESSEYKAIKEPQGDLFGRYLKSTDLKPTIPKKIGRFTVDDDMTKPLKINRFDDMTNPLKISRFTISEAHEGIYKKRKKVTKSKAKKCKRMTKRK